MTGSNKADSYIRAIGYANTMLKGFGGKFQNIGDIFSIDSVDQLKALHEFFLARLRKGIRACCSKRTFLRVISRTAFAQRRCVR